MQQHLPEVLPGRHVGTWCHWGAVIIALLGVIQLLILIVQNQTLLPIIGLISGTIFSALVLYAVGTLVNAHAGGGRP